MRTTQRLILKVVLALFGFALISLISAAPTVSKAEPIGKILDHSASVASAAPTTPISDLAWSLGIAVTGLTTIFRRKAS